MTKAVIHLGGSRHFLASRRDLNVASIRSGGVPGVASGNYESVVFCGKTKCRVAQGSVERRGGIINGIPKFLSNDTKRDSKMP